MPGHLTDEQRFEIIEFAEAGHTAKATAIQFGVHPSTVSRLMAKSRKIGALEACFDGRRRKRSRKLAPHMAFLLRCIRDEPKITLKQLQDRLEVERGVCVHITSLKRALDEQGWIYLHRYERGRKGFVFWKDRVRF